MASTISNLLLDVNLNGNLALTQDLGSSTFPIKFNQTLTGTATKCFMDGRTGSESFDCSASLTDNLGQTITLTTINWLIIKNTHATNALSVGGGTNAIIPAFSIPAGLFVILPLNLTVDSTHKIITFGAGTYNLILLGV